MSCRHTHDSRRRSLGNKHSVRGGLQGVCRGSVGGLLPFVPPPGPVAASDQPPHPTFRGSPLPGGFPRRMRRRGLPSIRPRPVGRRDGARCGTMGLAGYRRGALTGGGCRVPGGGCPVARRENSQRPLQQPRPPELL
eukprot:1181055-Prorocentrum_minimum.AAC.1